MSFTEITRDVCIGHGGKVMTMTLIVFADF